MNKLDQDHLHLLIDEPIYVLEEHGNHLVDAEEPEVNYSGENRQGIAIFLGPENELTDAEDKEMLFIGLKALDISPEDIALVNADYKAGIKCPEHRIRIEYQEDPKADERYVIAEDNEITYLICHRLHDIRQSQDLKVKYWLALKELFPKK